MNRYGARLGVRCVHDPVRLTKAVLYPEGAVLLNDTAADIVQLCDGQCTQADIVLALCEAYEDVDGQSVAELLEDLVSRRILAADGTGHPVRFERASGNATVKDPAPIGLLAELTHRCPLRCSYCANPIELTAREQEMETTDWVRVFAEARNLGVLQLHLSGGEPLLRGDLTELVRHARGLGMYTNLITSGTPLSERRLAALARAGLDHVQLSIQDSNPAIAQTVTGADAYQRKLMTAGLVRLVGLPLTVNVVLHAGNIDRIKEIAELALAAGAMRLELAHTQFYGWAWRNRQALMPTREQIDTADREIAELAFTFGDSVEIVYVSPDYHTGVPKPCMNGWGSRQIVVSPNGDALPCLAAAQLPGMSAPSVRDIPLPEIWYSSIAFNRFRGTQWLAEPCQSCALREVDFGGCRCQAYQILGDPAATDPVCLLSPHRGLVDQLMSPQFPAPPVLRTMK